MKILVVKKLTKSMLWQTKSQQIRILTMCLEKNLQMLKHLENPTVEEITGTFYQANYLKKYCFVQLKDQSTARSQNLLGWFFYLGNIDGLPLSEYIEKRLQKPNIPKSY